MSAFGIYIKDSTSKEEYLVALRELTRMIEANGEFPEDYDFLKRKIYDVEHREVVWRVDAIRKGGAQ